MPTQSIIPSFENYQLQALDKTTEVVLEDIAEQNEDFRTLANSLLCQEKYLPYLAYSYKVDFWNDFFTEKEKRELIKRSILLHSMKGTIWAIEEVLDLVGFTDRKNGLFADIKEGLRLTNRNGTYTYNSIFNHFSNKDWTKYIIYVPIAISIAKANFAKELIEAYAPARCELVAVVYKQLPNRDAKYFYNNEITHGVIGETNG